MDKYLGKDVRIIDIEDIEWTGYVSSIETPYDSDDGQWWLDIVNVNKPGFETGLSISESEIKEISEVNNGEDVDVSKLTPQWLGINDRYFEYIFDTLDEEGFILNAAYIEDYAGKYLQSDIMISPKGISYLHENSTIQKVKRSIKGISDIVGNINPL